MASTALLRRIPSSVLSSRKISHPPQQSRATRTLGTPQWPLPRLRQVGLRERAGSVVRIRGFSGEGGASEKEEAGASSSTGENGKSGAAVADSSSSSPGGSAKGFGASVRPAAAKPALKDKKKPGTIRRSAPEKPLIQSAPADNQVSQLETAYVVSLTFLFGLIFVEGIALAASGFLPEEWDQFIVNTLYPSFTPTVGLFLLLAAGYGVFKYLGLGPSEK